MEIKVYPFSFVEYLTYYGITDGYDDAFDQYVRTGGMPGAYVYKTEDDSMTMLEMCIQPFLSETW